MSPPKFAPPKGSLSSSLQLLSVLTSPQILLVWGLLEAGPPVTDLLGSPESIPSDRIYFVFCTLPEEEESAKTTLAVLVVIQRETEA